MKKILHIVLNNYDNDNRVRRAAECGLENDFDITVYAISDFDSSIKTNEAGVKVHRFYLLTRSLPKRKFIQLFKYFEIFSRMVYMGFRYKPNIVHAHDLDGLAIGYFISRLTGAKLIYDSHEYWTDTGLFGPANSRITKMILLIEKVLIKKASHVITVSESIAILIKDKYKIAMPSLVRNVPEPWQKNPNLQLRKKLGISHETVVVLYQGVINGEGVIDLVKAFKDVKGNVVLVYLGNGSSVAELKNYNIGLIDRIYFHPSVSYKDLPSFTKDADIGVHSMIGSNINRINALPNKIFEYIQGGLALVVSDLPEMAKVVDQYKIGLTYPNGNVEELTKQINILVSNKKLRDQYKEASIQCAGVLNWDEEKKKLQNIYKSLIA